MLYVIAGVLIVLIVGYALYLFNPTFQEFVDNMFNREPHEDDEIKEVDKDTSNELIKEAQETPVVREQSGKASNGKYDNFVDPKKKKDDTETNTVKSGATL